MPVEYAIALGGVEIGRHMPSEQPRAMTMAISAALVETVVARPMPMGISRFAEAECEMTFEVTQPTSASTKIRRMPGIEAHWIDPSHPLVEARGGHARAQSDTARDQPQDRPVQSAQVIAAHHLGHQQYYYR